MALAHGPSGRFAVDLDLYRLHDNDAAKRKLGALRVTKDSAQDWNDQAYGIFWTPNEFSGRRAATNLKQIRWWFVEVDGDKDQTLQRIRSAPIRPSMVVESKNGLHLYWKATDATPEEWKPIVRDRLVPWFDGDPKATDVCRILRVPGFLHQKDPSDPFLVSLVWFEDTQYLEQRMLKLFPERGKPPVYRAPTDREQCKTFVEYIDSFPAQAMLPALNGHWLMAGEAFRLEQTARGNYNIVREDDSYSTGCFIDEEGRIGAPAGEGGPVLSRWCRWYGNSWAEIEDGFRECFPEEAEQWDAFVRAGGGWAGDATPGAGAPGVEASIDGDWVH